MWKGCVWMMLLALGLVAAPVSELLKEFRREYALEAGTGLGRTPRELSRRKRGTHLELTMAFKSILEQEGYPCRVVLGKIGLTPAQQERWSHLPWETLREAISPGTEELGFSWLELEAPILPDMMTRDAPHSRHAMLKTELFPALCGFERASEATEECLAQMEPMDIEGILAMEWDPSGALRFYPHETMQEGFFALFSPGQSLEGGTIDHPLGIPGNAIHPQFRAVAIRSRDYCGEGVPDGLAATLRLSIRHGGELLTAQTRQEATNALCLEWQWEDTGRTPVAGDSLDGRTLRLLLKAEGRLLATSEGIPPGEGCHILLTREVGKSGWTDLLQGTLMAGADAQLILAPEQLPEHPTMALLEACEHSRRLAELAAHRHGTAQLRGALLTSIPQYAYTDGRPKRLSAFIPAISFLQNLSRSQPRHAASVLNALVPMATAESLLAACNPQSILCALRNGDPARAAQIRRLPPGDIPCMEAFYAASPEPPHAVIQLNEDYPRHFLALHSNGECHSLLQFAADSPAMPNLLYFPKGLEVATVDYAPASMLSAILGRRLMALGDALPEESLALAQATLVAISGIASDSALSHAPIPVEPPQREPPALFLDSIAFDGNEHIGEIEVIARTSNLIPARIEVLLNGEPFTEIAMPETPVSLFTIPPQALRDGPNVVSARAWSAHNLPSEWLEYRIVAPTVTSLEVTPSLVQSWNGTPNSVTMTASMRTSHAWTASIAGYGILEEQTGESATASATFDVSAFRDGLYTLLFTVHDAGASYAITVEVDNVRGSPVAAIDYPQADSLVEEGLISIRGSACATLDDFISYRLSLVDERGQEIPLEDGGLQGRHALVAIPGASAQHPGIDRRCTPLDETELAWLDASGLPNGIYTLSLAVTASGSTASTSVTFTLFSRLKTGAFVFTEEDFSLRAGTMPVKISRHYSSQERHDRGFGHGWSCNKEFLEPSLDETRAELDSLDGIGISVRTGGTRNVTVTLSNGQRCTFRFQLQPGGGYSFCYYALWQAPSGIDATLVPSCSNKLMTLTGLDPYWEAAGPETPWELFDFPGFVLMEGNGTRSILSRELLAEGEITSDGTLPIASGDGEAIYLQSYGELKLASQTLPEGQTFLFDDTSIATLLDGRRFTILEMEWDEARSHILSATSYLADGRQSLLESRMEYEYRDGNLVAVRRGRHGAACQLIRSYEYGYPTLPHLVTAVRNGNGALLMGAQYDSRGRMVAAHANGEAVAAQSSPLAGYETRTDGLGRETTIFFDAYGSILEELAPNGARQSYRYDENHREISSTDPYGNTVAKTYDGNGNLARITRPDGSQATFSYEGGRCVEATGFSGNSTHFSYDTQGRLASFKAPNGNLYHATRDSDGNLTALTLNGELLSQSEYDGSGRLASVTDYATGTQYAFQYDRYGNTTQTTFTLFPPGSSQATTFTSQSEYDDENRLTSTSLSNGYWECFQYDSNGNLSRRVDCDGTALAFLYDASGQVVQVTDENGLVTRYGHDAAGQTLFIAGPEKVDSEPGLFQKAVCYAYDSAGCPVETTVVSNAWVALDASGPDSWRATLLSCDSPKTARSGFDLKGRLTSTQSREGFVTHFAYDANDRIAARTDHYGNRTQFERNAAGLVTRIQFPDEAALLYEYDSCGRLLRMTTPLGHVEEYATRDDGRLLTHTLPDKRAIRYGYDGQGLLRSVALPSSTGEATYSYEYDSVLSPTAIETPSGRRIAFANDELGRRIATELPLGQRSTCIYETPGLLPVQVVDFAGNAFRYEYDRNGRVVAKSITPPRGGRPAKRYAYEYRPNGKLARAVLQGDQGTGSSIACSYDALGQLDTCTREAGNIACQHDDDGNLSGLAWGDTRLSIRKSKDAPLSTTTYSQLDGRAFPEGAAYSTTFDARGRASLLARPDGSTRRCLYDLDGALASIVECDGDKREIYRYSCTRDACGRIVDLRENRDGTTIRREYRYDECGRLAAEEVTCGDETQRSEYLYDRDSNLTRRTDANGAEPEASSFHYDGNGRLVRIESESSTRVLSWDDNGALLSILEYADDGSLASSQRFQWDCEGLLRGTTLSTPARTLDVAYDYDALGLLKRETCMEAEGGARRFRYRCDTLYFAPDTRTLPLLLEIASRDAEGALLHRQTNIWENGLAGFHRDGRLYSCICDGGGSPLGTRSETGEWEGWRDYTAWGVPIQGPEELEPGLGYRGELYSPATGLLYLRSRFYMPALGIFISADRHEPDLKAPLEFSRHAYCRNDPVNRCDPLGSFSLLSMPLATGLSLGTALRIGICVELAAETIYSAYLSQEMALEFESGSRDEGNATVIVHGVWRHEPNYAGDFVERLKRHAANQDYYQFRWSGFGGLLPMSIPSSIQHNIAQRSLEFCLGSLQSKGYANINLIGHSWGTVLSKDALNTGVIDVGLWATMGSPLAYTGRYDTPDGSPSDYPRFNYGKWMNFYNLCDPVVYLCMNGPLVSLGGPIAGTSPLSPLFESPIPEQYNLGFITEDVHGCYWYNPTAILAITLFTRHQR